MFLPIADINKKLTAGMNNCIDCCVQIQKGVLWLGEGVSRVLTYVYNPKGLAALSKVLLASFDLASLIDATARGALAESVKNIKNFKDVLYATFWVTSASDLIVNPKSRTIEKTLNCMGDFCELFKFLDKNGVCSFSLVKEGAGFCNSLCAPGAPFAWGDCPVPINPFCERPKEFFIFWSSVIDVIKGIGDAYAWARNVDPNKKIDVVSLAKRTSSLGKIILINFGNASLGLAIVDNVTQLAGLVKLIIEKEKQHQARHALVVI